MHGYQDSVIQRFWKYVNKTDTCWLWTGATHPGGYGVLNINRRAILTHRISYTIHVGAIPEGLFCCHRCAVRLCVNPEHLYVGTAYDNVHDMLDDRGHWSQYYPDRVLRGNDHWTKIHPERVARGERSGSYTHPERQPRGERHGSKTHPESRPNGTAINTAKLTEEQVREIRRLYREEHWRKSKLARTFGMAQSTIGDLLRHKIWAHVSD